MKDRDKFAAWLEGQGAQIQAPTNPWEVLRYRSGNITSIVYQNKKGRLTWIGESEADYKRFKSARPLADLTQGERKKIRAQLFERDGPECWYCDEFLPRHFVLPMSDDFPTIEHLVPLSEGGTHVLANLALAHRDCNERADNAPLARKIELRAEFRRRHETTPPWESVRTAA